MASFFNKKLQHSCAYCVHGRKSEYGDDVFCKKRGVTDSKDYCRHYKYDPLKRQPLNIKPADNYNADDFKL